MRCIGVCSWSLRAGSAEELVERLRATGLRALQLALDPLELVGTGPRSVDAVSRVFADAGVEILSGMMATVGEDYTTLETIRATGGLVPDATWPENRERAVRNATLARRLGLDLVSFHAGFPGEEPSRERDTLLARLRDVANLFAEEGVRLALETGQETAACLADTLSELERPSVGVNFDPANLILYGNGDPIAALELLAPHVLQFHIKDALPTTVPGTWGTEVRAGEGAVDWTRFLALAASRCIQADLVIEREAGEDRTDDIRAAKSMLETLGRLA